MPGSGVRFSHITDQPLIIHLQKQLSGLLWHPPPSPPPPGCPGGATRMGGLPHSLGIIPGSIFCVCSRSCHQATAFPLVPFALFFFAFFLRFLVLLFLRFLILGLGGFLGRCHQATAEKTRCLRVPAWCLILVGPHFLRLLPRFLCSYLFFLAPHLLPGLHYNTGTHTLRYA